MSRHIDALIAEYLFKNEIFQPQHFDPEKIINNSIKPIPKYSSDISAAWAVVEKMHDRKYISRIQSPAINYVPEKWSVCFHFKYMDDEIFIKEKEMDESAPMAICLAALKVLGVKYE